MAMRDQEVVGIAFVDHELIAEAPNTGAGIHDERVTALGNNFQAGRITTVAKIFFPANRDGSPGSPNLY
jgi:hypothetical protein